jgi:hypothetical protein
MGIPFLSDEYMQAGVASLAGDAGVQKAIAGVDVALLFEVTGGPDGDFSYYIDIGEGGVDLARGALENPSATIRSSYETAARLARKELSNQMALMTGKVKIAGSLGALMKHATVLDLIQSRLSDLDIEY